MFCLNTISFDPNGSPSALNILTYHWSVLKGYSSSLVFLFHKVRVLTRDRFKHGRSPNRWSRGQDILTFNPWCGSRSQTTRAYISHDATFFFKTLHGWLHSTPLQSRLYVVSCLIQGTPPDDITMTSSWVISEKAPPEPQKT